MGASDAYERNRLETLSTPLESNALDRLANGADPGDVSTPIARAVLDARFTRNERVGVLLVQHEANSFASRTTSIDAFTMRFGADAADSLAGANNEFAGAIEAISGRGGIAVPLLAAHAMPSGPLDAVAYEQLRDIAVRSIGTGLDALVVSLHGALSSVDTPDGDRALLAAIRDAVGPDMPIALALDLHGNATTSLCALAQVTTGYRTNPHTDLAETGRRAAAMLAAVVSGTVRPVTAVETCPAIFPDESLRIPGGVLADILQRARAAAPDSVIDISVFPTQPWLDAPGIGFTAVAVAHDDAAAAGQTVSSIARQVWDRRSEFVVDRLLAPQAALDAARASDVRPFVIAEAADAPTAGASGDGTGMLAALLDGTPDRSALITIVDERAVAVCHTSGNGAEVSLLVGATVDPRWSEPVELAGVVERIGSGEYTLTGAGYTGLTATMGRYAVVRRGRQRVLITELPAWSSDPGTWRHAGLDPFDVDVLCVRSCTDYRANFPASAPSAVVADVPGAAASRLDRLRFERCDIVPYPVDGDAAY
jgi:microcystin degradation protein MlrC